MSFEFPDQSKLPSWFVYPEPFLKMIRLNLLNLEPWVIMDHDHLFWRLEGLKQRYPQRELVPFARRVDNDDIACFERGKGEAVQLIHDFASPGWEQRKEYRDFWEWFKEAIDDMIFYD